MTRKSPRSLVFAIVVLAWQTTFAQTTDNYKPGPDSKPQPGVPKGEVIKLNFDKSKIFPDTARDYWIYIIPTPNRRLSNLTFGGEQFDTLYATCGDRIYKRKLRVKGAQAWDKPIKPAPPRL